jgi:hypothetical protein
MAFSTRYELYEYLVISFGLTNDDTLRVTHELYIHVGVGQVFRGYH